MMVPKILPLIVGKASIMEQPMIATSPLDLIGELNIDLALEYSAAIQYIQHASMLTGATEVTFAKELLSHADEEMGHAKEIANRINYLGGVVTTDVSERKIARTTFEMINQDLDGERVAITRYTERIKQAEASGDLGTAQMIREILLDEEEHENDLETYLGK